MKEDVLQLIGSAIQSQIVGARVESTASGIKLVSLSSQRGKAIVVTAQDAAGISTQFLVDCKSLNPAPPVATEGGQDESAMMAAKASEPEVPADAGEATETTEAAATDAESIAFLPVDAKVPVSNPEPQPAVTTETPAYPGETPSSP